MDELPLCQSSNTKKKLVFATYGGENHQIPVVSSERFGKYPNVIRAFSIIGV